MRYVLARSKWDRQVNFRLDSSLHERLKAESERRKMPTNYIIMEACEAYLAGPTTAPTVVSGSVDQGARDALQALLARVQTMEQEIVMLTNRLQQIEERPQPEPEPVDDDFAKSFLRS